MHRKKVGIEDRCEDSLLDKNFRGQRCDAEGKVEPAMEK
jgi:hypothetical protein